MPSLLLLLLELKLLLLAGGWLLADEAYAFA